MLIPLLWYLGGKKIQLYHDIKKQVKIKKLNFESTWKSIDYYLERHRRKSSNNGGSLATSSLFPTTRDWKQFSRQIMPTGRMNFLFCYTKVVCMLQRQINVFSCKFKNSLSASYVFRAGQLRIAKVAHACMENWAILLKIR